MASGDTLCRFVPASSEPPASNAAGPDVRNATSPHPVLSFDDTTQEIAIFTDIMPQNYANTTGVTVYLHWAAASATTGTIGWDVTFENNSDGTDLDSDSWATAQTVTAATVPGTAGVESITNVACAKGATAMDTVVAGNQFRLRIRRDVANDTAAGDAHLLSVEIRET